jgi:hypothetical protein
VMKKVKGPAFRFAIGRASRRAAGKCDAHHCTENLRVEHCRRTAWLGQSPSY